MLLIVAPCVSRITVLNRFVGGDTFSRSFNPASGEGRVVSHRDSLTKSHREDPGIRVFAKRARQSSSTRFFFIPFTFRFDFLPERPGLRDPRSLMRRRGFTLPRHEKLLILALYCLALVPSGSIAAHPESLRFLSRCCGFALRSERGLRNRAVAVVKPR